MKLRNVVKKCKPLKAAYQGVRQGYYALLTCISPELNTKARYRAVFGKKLDLDAPRTFNEKLLWLKLRRYISDPLAIQCADKCRVRDYIEEKGCGDILNDVIGIYDRAEDIPWDELPDRFVLKWNFGAGMNIVCTDKSALNRDAVIRQMSKWGRSKYWLAHAEMQYKHAPKKILCEKFLEDATGGGLPDYKVYCFHGKPLAILVMHDRGKVLKTEFFDTSWQQLENTDMYLAPAHSTQKPACLDQMLRVSERLSEPFPFVRCDYYVVDGKLFFGELTFTPAGGLYTAQTKINGKEMTEYLNIP